MSDELESVLGEIPGPRSRALAASLAATESRGITYLSPQFPVFWESARGATVTDVDGNRYLDLTAAFGVAATGHANEAVAHAIAEQAARLPHGMGDVHPSDRKAQLLEKLAAIAPVERAKTFLCSTGAEAVEFALKTALLATGEPDVLAFAGAYHGLSYGALEVCGISKFRKPWQRQLRGSTSFARFPDPREPRSAERTLDLVRKTLRKNRSVGAVLVEPILGRAGVVIPPEGFLGGLRELCDSNDALLIFDEIYTGFGKTGTLFACEHEGIRPDVLCVGKAMGGGFPISAAIARGDVADAWEPSQGEALHTSTYLGNPMGCAAALANIAEIERLDLVANARRRESFIGERLHAIERVTPGISDVRGRGMLWAMEFRDPSVVAAAALRALQKGLLVLASGLRGNVLTIAPPLTIGTAQLHRAFDLLEAAVREPAFA